MSKWQAVRNFFLHPVTLCVVYLGLAIFAALQQISFGTHPYAMPSGKVPADIMNSAANLQRFVGTQLTEYNNYLIFKHSYYHLAAGKNLYDIYPGEHWDYYKYSPTFAVFMGALAYLPDRLGLSLWNIMNAMALFTAVWMLPFKIKAQSLLLWFAAAELLTSMQNCQSNGLLAGLIIAAFACMQRSKVMWAALWLVAATYIKVYGAVGFILFLLYPDKIKFVLYALLWSVLFFLLPLIVTSWHTQIWQYTNWFALLAADQSASYGLSVAGWLHAWFGLSSGKTVITAAGLLLFMVPFARIKLYADKRYRLLLLSFMLVWVIIFNHKAESPTFIIAVAGAGIWYFASPRSAWRMAVLLLVFVFTTLSPSDLFPAQIRHTYFVPYVIKAVPCILLWCIMFIELIAFSKTKDRPAPSLL